MSFWSTLFSRGRTRRVHEIAERSAPTREDLAWLEEQAERDPSLASTHDRLRRWHEAARTLPQPTAPTGFADEVLRRARVEHAEVQPVRARPRWGWIGLATAAGVAAFVVGVEMRTDRTEIATSGSSGAWAQAAPDLVIRAPEIGVVEAREVFESTVARHGGRVERLESAVVARVTRRSLLPLLRALSEHGPFEVARPSTETDVPPTVMLRLELAPPSVD
jgi:hypothetical protein